MIALAWETALNRVWSQPVDPRRAGMALAPVRWALRVAPELEIPDQELPVPGLLPQPVPMASQPAVR